MVEQSSKLETGSPKGLKFFPVSYVARMPPLPLAGTLHGPKKAEAVPGVTSRHGNSQVSTGVIFWVSFLGASAFSTEGSLPTWPTSSHWPELGNVQFLKPVSVRENGIIKTVLDHWFPSLFLDQNQPEELSNNRMLGPTPRISDSVGLRWG